MITHLIFFNFLSLDLIHGPILFIKLLQSLLYQLFSLKRRRLDNPWIDNTICLVFLEMLRKCIFLHQFQLFLLLLKGLFESNLIFEVWFAKHSHFLSLFKRFLLFLLLHLHILFEHLPFHGSLDLQNALILSIQIVKQRNLICGWLFYFVTIVMLVSVVFGVTVFGGVIDFIWFFMLNFQVVFWFILVKTCNLSCQIANHNSTASTFLWLMIHFWSFFCLYHLVLGLFTNAYSSFCIGSLLTIFLILVAHSRLCWVIRDGLCRISSFSILVVLLFLLISLTCSDGLGLVIAGLKLFTLAEKALLISCLDLVLLMMSRISTITQDIPVLVALSWHLLRTSFFGVFLISIC